MNQIIGEHLDPIASRMRFKRAWLLLSGFWLLSALIAVALLAANHWLGIYWNSMTIGAILLSAFLTCVAVVLSMPRRSDYQLVAQRIEARFPDLDSTLITALGIRPDPGDGRLGYLQQSVIRNAIYHNFQNSWGRIVPTWQLLFGPLVCMLSLACLGAALISLNALLLDPFGNSSKTAFDKVVLTDSKLTLSVEPGSTQIERGSSLLVIVRFKGLTPPTASLVWYDSEGNQQQLPMNKSLSDPVFAARIDVVNEPLDYYVDYESQKSDVFHVGVFELPKLMRADVELDYPEYSEMPNRVLQDVRRVSALQGTVATLRCQLNKRVDQAFLQDRNDHRISLDLVSSNLYAAEFEFTESARYELHLIDEQGRTNRSPPIFTFSVLINQPPKIKLINPARDLQVSPLEEVSTAAEAWDDFGLKAVGLSYAWAGEQEHEIKLGDNLPPKQSTPLKQMLSMEKFSAKPDQLLSYFYWAEDVGPDGKLRRTSSDMYFAEVRHFEEIFRQGNQPANNQMQSNQSGQNAQQAGQLAELQKQIINATWKLIRRSASEGWNTELVDDLATVLDSQQSLIDQVVMLRQMIQDPQAATFIDSVDDHMNDAVRHLTAAKSKKQAAELSEALVDEQLAYQALLKTKAREHQVVRNQMRNSQQNSGNQSSRSQQQLEQLQMSNDENRYETQNLARDEESPEAREDRQILNRLRELARRQNDLNERVKELQTALQKAGTEEEKNEIERQLKRLREEQQQILRDTDELRERMERPENQQRMSEQSRQVDQARENIRQASEALQEGQISRAAAEGTRAENELRQLRDEFQKQSSNQFAEEMRELRDQARVMDQAQDDVRNRLQDLDQNANNNRSLREGDDLQEINETLQQQEELLQQIQEQIRDTIERAEPVEPLLAQELYDTYRRTQQDRPEDALRSASRSLRQGFIDDGRREERRAAKGIRDMREGIDRAAEAVLGDETDALRPRQRGIATIESRA